MSLVFTFLFVLLLNWRSRLSLVLNIHRYFYMVAFISASVISFSFDYLLIHYDKDRKLRLNYSIINLNYWDGLSLYASMKISLILRVICFWIELFLFLISRLPKLNAAISQNLYLNWSQFLKKYLFFGFEVSKEITFYSPNLRHLPFIDSFLFKRTKQMMLIST